MEAMRTTEHPDFEAIRAILRETAEQQKEWKKENAEQQKKWQKEAVEQQKKWQKEAAERQKETDRMQKDFNERFGFLTGRFGEIVEYMVAPNLREKFTEFGLDFPKVNQNTRVDDKLNKISLEIDIMLENGDKAMLVEVKTKLSTEDVKEHIERLEKIRVYADLHGDKRVFLGAVAGVVMTPNVKKFALTKGFYVVEPSGETFDITPPNGQPREF
jgi:hypothetical protein